MLEKCMRENDFLKSKRTDILRSLYLSIFWEWNLLSVLKQAVSTKVYGTCTEAQMNLKRVTNLELTLAKDVSGNLPAHSHNILNMWKHCQSAVICKWG